MSPCYSPLTAYRVKSGRRSDGRWPIVFSRESGDTENEVQVPCGQCIGCKLEKSRQWAMRMQAEANTSETSHFLTLTYDNKNLKERCKNGSLNKRDICLFIKRLRKSQGNGIRFYQCGEYGDENLRPHHHVIVYGAKFENSGYVNKERTLYRSADLERLWPHGFSTIGRFTFESAAYVARYVTKKVTGKKAEAFYKGRTPEYATMSRRPGIGKAWFEKYKKDILSQDSMIMRGGVKMPPPRYFDKLYEKENPLEMEVIKAKRIAKVNKEDNTLRRLRAKRAARESFLKLKKRKL